MVSSSNTPPEEIAGLFGDGPSRPSDPLWYAAAATAVMDKANAGAITPLACNQAIDALERFCDKFLNMTLADATNYKPMTLQDFCQKNILDLGSNDVEALSKIITKSKKLTRVVKKKSLLLLERLLEIQKKARDDSMVMWIYVLRDSEGKACDHCGSSRIRPRGFTDDTTQHIACESCGHEWDSEQFIDSEGMGFFDIQWFHKAWFMAWQCRHHKKTLIEAPPGHGKTTCARGHRAWKIGKRPTIRMLLLYDVDVKAPRGIELLRKVIQHSRYRAIFPDIRVLRRSEGEELSKRRFTVSNHNEFSREATVEGFAIRSGVNGNGYDYVGADDICSPDVRWQPYTRKQINERWGSVIEQRLRDHASAEIDYICTPWHADDTAGQIVQDVDNGRTSGWLVLIKEFAIRNNADGKAIPLWPRKYPQEVLEDMKARNPNYNCTHRLDSGREMDRAIRRLKFYPSVQDNTMLHDRDLRRMEVIAQSERWLSIDPSASNSAWSSDTGIVECVITPAGYAYCTNVWFLKKSPVAMQNWIIRQLYYRNDPGYAGVQIEAQGAMKGQVSLWIKSIQDALALGRIPARGKGEEEDDEILEVEPYTRDLLIVTTNTRMGGAKQNMSKHHRLREASRIIEDMLYFAGDKYGKEGDTWYRSVKGSTIERLHTILLNFDGTNNSDAVDALTQWCIYNSDRITNPAFKAATTTPAQRRASGVSSAFRTQMEFMQKAAANKERGDGEAEFFQSLRGTG